MQISRTGLFSNASPLSGFPWTHVAQKLYKKHFEKACECDSGSSGAISERKGNSKMN